MFPLLQALLMGNPEQIPPQTDVDYTGPNAIYGSSVRISEVIEIGATFRRDGTVETWGFTPDSSDSGQREYSYSTWSTVLDPNRGEDYDIRFTDVSSSNSMNTPGYGVWWGLEVPRTVEMTMAGFGSYSQTLKVELKHKDNEIVLQEFFIYFQVAMDPGAT